MNNNDIPKTSFTIIAPGWADNDLVKIVRILQAECPFISKVFLTYLDNVEPGVADQFPSDEKKVKGYQHYPSNHAIIHAQTAAWTADEKTKFVGVCRELPWSYYPVVVTIDHPGVLVEQVEVIVDKELGCELNLTQVDLETDGPEIETTKIISPTERSLASFWKE